MGRSSWGTLTRTELRAFDEDQTKAILYAMDHGGVGRISNSGHAIIRNQQGQTMSVSRSSGGRRKQNVAADLCRLFGAPDEVLDREATTKAQPNAPEPVQLTAVSTTEDSPVLGCPAKGCGATFVTEGARYTHVDQLHWKCQEPGCEFVGRVAQSVVLHHTRVHRGINPTGNRSRKSPARKAPALEAVPAATAHNDPPSPEQPQTPPAPETAPDVVTQEATHYDAVEVLERVRDALGEDPRIATLQAKVDELVKERDDALAQLSLIREALHLTNTGT